MKVSPSSVRKPSAGSVHLDALRGAAALVVFGNHTRALYFSSPLQKAEASQLATRQQAPPPNDRTSQPVGEIKFASEAVVIFFVLSGYLVGGSVIRLIRSARWSWRVYLTKRITRLYVVLIPAVLIGVLLDYLGFTLFGPGSAYHSPPGIELGTTVHLLQRLGPKVILGNFLFLNGIFVPHPGSNAALWSLANEFWYYIAFPFGALAVAWKSNWIRQVIYGLAAVLILVFVGWHIAVLFPIWLCGAMVSILPRPLSQGRAKIFSCLFAALLLVGMIGVRIVHMQAIPAEFLVGSLVSPMLWAVVQQTQPASKGIYGVCARFFSNISYSLYLFHLPIAYFVSGLVNSPWRPFARNLKDISIFLGTDMFIVFVVYLLWLTFEARTDRIRAFVFREEMLIMPAD